MESGVIVFSQLVTFVTVLSTETALSSILFRLVSFLLDQNELAVLTRENSLYYGSLGILPSSLIKVGTFKVLFIAVSVRNYGLLLKLPILF